MYISHAYLFPFMVLIFIVEEFLGIIGSALLVSGEAHKLE